MMRVFWDEWRGGTAYTARRMFPFLAVAAALGLLGLVFQPGALFEVLACACLGGGVLSGTQRWNAVPGWTWVAEGVAPAGYAAGKAAGWTGLSAVWILFMVPPLILEMVLWSVPWELAVACAAWAWAGGLAAQALGQAVTWNRESGPFFGAALVLGCLVLSLLLPSLQPLNPLWQIGRLCTGPGQDPDLGALAGLLVGAAALWALRVPFLRGQGTP